MSENYDAMRKVDQRINEVKQNYIALNRPVTAFLTFENEEGINRAKEYNETVQKDRQFEDIKTMLGCTLDF